MTRFSLATKALAVILVTVSTLSAASPALAANRPKFQAVEYSYDQSAGTFTLYTKNLSGETYFTGATLQVNGGTIRSDASCWMNSYFVDGAYWGDSTCVFTNVAAPLKTMASTAALVDSPTATDPNTYFGDFKDTCRRTLVEGCSGSETVKMTVPK